MELLFQNLNQGLNKGYLKQGVTRTEINLFKANLVRMFGRIDESESEEHLKNIVADFLKETYYKNRFEINTKDRKDLVIHHGKSAKDPVGVILEAKKPSNKAEMPNKERQNVKALHELLLYYLREVHENNNHEIKYLVATNIWEWFIFDGVWFEKNVSRNAELKKKYTDWTVSGNSTQHFYDYTAKVFFQKEIDSSTTLTNPEKLPCTYFNLKDFQKLAQNPECEEDNELISLYKTFSPEHLLRKPFANDSNTLNKEFYFELLYILGLEEVKEGTKKVIQRYAEGKRKEGSLLENTISKLIISKKIAENQLSNEEEIFSIALELCITWLNRILFLKLLEGQIIKYHQDNRDYAFLNEDKIRDFDELEELFFEVLAVPVAERREVVQQKFQNIPYLNSSLFDISELEKEMLALCQLKNRLEMPIYAQSVLKDVKGNKVKGNKNTLVYLFQFLNSYNFAQENAEIQAESKSIINAAVLGLIFEKLNGYKDGSFFTPGYITMYMCRETIRKAVVQKFNEKYNWKYEDFEKLKENIDFRDKKVREEANELINSLKICDPSVGSGHFLVSALNEILLIKSELQVLCFKDGTRMREYRLTVEHDEILINDFETNALFEYRLNKYNQIIEPKQAVQEALFYEKQTIIENCLFGVDINPKSVSICRLRLWIELLKSMYYIALPPAYQSRGRMAGELETLPNLDINIKVGNSLVNRYPLNTDLEGVFRSQKYSVQTYKMMVSAYKNTKSYERKEEFKRFLAEIKDKFRENISINDPLKKKLSEWKGKKFMLDNQQIVGDLFGKSAISNELNPVEEMKNIEKLIQKTEKEIKDKENAVLYKNALEWRFDFPEILDDKGNFVGFDVIVGNPPWGVSLKEAEKNLLSQKYADTISSKTKDTYLYFFMQNEFILAKNGFMSLILPNTWMLVNNTKAFRQHFLTKQIFEIVDYGDGVFDEATVECCSFVLQISQPTTNNIATYKYEKAQRGENISINKNIWLADSFYRISIGSSSDSQQLIKKLALLGVPFEEKCDIIWGIKPYQVGHGEPSQTKEMIEKRIYHADNQINELWKPLLKGSNINRYFIDKNNTQYILYGKNLMYASNQNKMENPKILIRQTSENIKACYDEDKFYCQNSVFIVTSESIDLKYLLAILNSKLANFYYTTKNPQKGKIFPEIKPSVIKEIPIIFENIDAERNTLISLVSQIIDAKKKDLSVDITKLEAKIDQLVYQLYGLSKAEIAIIEGKN